MTTEDHARKISSGLTLGFDPLTILVAVLPILMRCLNPPSPAAMAASLQRDWDKDQGYKPKRIRAVEKRLRAAAESKGQPLNDADTRVMAIAILDHARTQPEAEVKAFGAIVGTWAE